MEGSEDLKSQTNVSKPFFRIFYNDVYEVKLPPNHRFPMEKYGKVRKLVQEHLAALPLSQQEKVRCDFQVSPMATIDELVSTHDREYVHRFMIGDQTEAELRNVGFPWSPAGVQRATSSTGGTVAAACAAVEECLRLQTPTTPSWAAHVAGGTHHAFRDRGEGFCVFSDIAVAANVVHERYPCIRRILIIDLDVHQGNGNAVLFADRPDVFTFSMHCSANYFSKKETSDLDIELPIGCGDETYLITLNHWLKQLKSQSFDLVFYQAGVDVIGHDRLGRLSLSHRGIERRNKMVYKFVQDLGVPCVITMGGGYPRNQDWSPIIAAHASCYTGAHSFLAEDYDNRMLAKSGTKVR